MLTMLDAQTGKLLSQKDIGGQLLIQPSIAEDANGKMEVVLTDMGSARWGPTFPGFIQALALSPNQTNVVFSSPGFPAYEFYGAIAVAVILLGVVVSLGFELKKVKKSKLRSN